MARSRQARADAERAFLLAMLGADRGMLDAIAELGEVYREAANRGDAAACEEMIARLRSLVIGTPHPERRAAQPADQPADQAADQAADLGGSLAAPVCETA